MDPSWGKGAIRFILPCPGMVVEKAKDRLPRVVANIDPSRQSTTEMAFEFGMQNMLICNGIVNPIFSSLEVESIDLNVIGGCIHKRKLIVRFLFLWKQNK